MNKTVFDVSTGITSVIPLTQDEIDAIPGDVPAPIPTVVTMRQARRALFQQGLLANVETAMQSAGQEALIDWEYAQTVEADSPLVGAMRDALGLTDDDVLGLFAIAGGL
ncbi:MAG TPA: hypothetical protein PK620_13050 [Denitromonas sp.]|nr:hypothetical protein [Denitromonas sp.]HQV15839.1 hypothetical protein [Denitromonas sp.]